MTESEVAVYDSIEFSALHRLARCQVVGRSLDRRLETLDKELRSQSKETESNKKTWKVFVLFTTVMQLTTMISYILCWVRSVAGLGSERGRNSRLVYGTWNHLTSRTSLWTTVQQNGCHQKGSIKIKIDQRLATACQLHFPQQDWVSWVVSIDFLRSGDIRSSPSAGIKWSSSSRRTTTARRCGDRIRPPSIRTGQDPIEEREGV